MRFLLPIVVSVVMLVAAGAALLRLRAVIQFEGVREQLEQISTNNSPIFNYSNEAHAFEETLAAGRKAAESALASAEPWVLLSRAYRSIGLRQQQLPQRVEYLCNALSALGSAIHLEPLGSGLLVNWANLRQMLGSVDCHQPNTTADFRRTLDFAVVADPTNPQILYSAALLQLWGGERTTALALFNRVLQYELEISKGQEQVILSHINSPEDLRATVPARFPQITHWSGIIKEQRAAEYARYLPILDKMQSKAIDLSQEELKQGKIDDAIHFDRMVRLFSNARGVHARKKLDLALSEHLKRNGQRPLAEYLMERARWRDLRFIPATLSADTRPSKSALVGWNSSQRVVLDDFYRSVGFYLPDGQLPRSIEIIGMSRSISIRSSDLHLLVSNDNQQWIEVERDLSIDNFDFDGRPLYVIRPQVGFFKYWKIHFASGARTQVVTNNLSDLIRVIGDSRLKDPS